MKHYWCEHISYDKHVNKWTMDIKHVVIGFPISQLINECPICQAQRPTIDDNSKVQIRNINEQICTLYSPNGMVGTITSFMQLLDVRVQIKVQKLYGYYITWGIYKINIDQYGKQDCWPKGFYTDIDELFDKILGIKTI